MAGFDVQVKAAGRLVLTQVDGKAMPVPLEEPLAIIEAKGRALEEALAPSASTP